MIIFILNKKDIVQRCKLKLPVLVWSLSSIQPFSHPLTLTSPCHWASFRVSLGKLFHFRFCSQTTFGAQDISNLHRHRPLREQIHTLVKWNLGDSCHVPREIHARPVYDSNQGTFRSTIRHASTGLTRNSTTPPPHPR